MQDCRPGSYVAGAFYQRTRFAQEDTTLVDATRRSAALDLLAYGGTLGSNRIASRAVETALFIDGEYALDLGWSVGLGARSYHTRLEYQIASVYSPLLGGATIAVQPHTNTRGTTPKLSVKHRFGEQQWYALASKGYRFGGINFNPPAMSTYESDSLWNYETGVRLAPSGNLKLDLTIFYLDWKNAQVTALMPASPAPLIGTANVGKARSAGLEVGMLWRPLRGLTLNAQLAYTDAATTADYTAGSGAIVRAGARLPGTARLQSTLQGSYSTAGPARSSVRYSATYSSVGGRVFDIEGRGAAPGYGQLDLRTGIERSNWSLTLFLNNLADRRGVAGATAGANLAFVDYYLIRPRTAGLTLRYDN